MKKAKPRNLPAVSIPRSTLENVLEIAYVIGILTMLFTLVRYWAALPDQIPTRFGTGGIPVAWGDKTALLRQLLVVVLISAGMTVLSRYPHLFNYPWLITEQNIRIQYQLARTLLSWIKVELVWLFGFTEWGSIQVALGRDQSLRIEYLWVYIAIIFGTIIIYFYESFKAR
ncbi:MAG: Uncharacterized protein XD78_0991 [Desulfotomaculum sp. 46_296]|nr:MAG: Uncharacterized protein XD78_0991 [Desulfotomaculum sp. 46_296]